MYDTFFFKYQYLIPYIYNMFYWVSTLLELQIITFSNILKIFFIINNIVICMYV